MPESSRRRIVIAGATGLIGSKLVAQLASRGDYVIALVRDPARARRAIPQAAQHIAWSTSMTDGAWADCIDGADGVYNLAGAPISVRWTAERKKDIYNSRIQGTRNIVDAIGRATNKPRVLVNASAVGYFGVRRDDRVTERDSNGNDFLARLCVDWEHEAARAESLDTRVVMIRTGLVLDPKGGALAKLLLPFKLFVGGSLGSGQQWFPWIHIADEVGLFQWALDNDDVRGPINAAAPGIVTNKDFSKMLGTVLHRPSLFPVPVIAMKILFGECAEVITGGQNIVPEKAIQKGYQFEHPELRKALENLLYTE